MRIKNNCDQCKHFRFGGHHENPCGKGHKMKFRTPKHMGDAVNGNWGYYVGKCKDRSSGDPQR